MQLPAVVLPILGLYAEVYAHHLLDVQHHPPPGTLHHAEEVAEEMLHHAEERAEKKLHHAEEVAEKALHHAEDRLHQAAFAPAAVAAHPDA